jgi:hypothetical protein
MTHLQPLIGSMLFLFLLGHSLSAQDCPGASNDEYLHGNNIRALINNSGSLFVDQRGDAAFNVPFTGAASTNTIFAAGLWMGAFTPEGNLHLSAPRYGYADNNPLGRDYDYLPGPLDENGNLPENCTDWDKVWSVTRFEIEQHQADYDADNTIDQPLEAIFAWPGLGNPHFETYNGFALPDLNQAFAPFFDRNMDGIYDPADGDYPTVSQSQTLPQQITWTIFNDLANEESNGLPLGFEVQLTSWALNCSENEQLNNTIFHSYKIINRSGTTYDSLHIGLWNDFDLGCFDDDFIGSAPELNTFFGYNSDNEDIDCSSGTPPYGMNPPAQAVTFLNNDLSYFNLFYNTSAGAPPPSTDPFGPDEIYNFLTGSWRDGSPLTFGGSGYDETGTNPPTPFAFPDDPNDPQGWSQVSEGLSPGDVRGLGSLDIGTFPPGQIQTIDVAYSYFREPGSSNLENVTAMYAGIADLQGWYDNGFDGECALPDLCTDDCVYPGDINADGIANYCDLLPIGLQHLQQDVTRPGPLFWAPQNGDAWATNQFDGTNSKHADANGNGFIDSSDFELTVTHYNQTTPDYIQPADVYQEGPELSIEVAGTSVDIENLEAGDGAFIRARVSGISDLYGIAFEMEYDTQYIESLEPFGVSGFTASVMQFSQYIPTEGIIEFARIAKDGETLIEDDIALFIARLQTQPVLPMSLPSDTTLIRFKNIKGVRTDGSSIDMGGTDAVLIFPGITVSTEEVVDETPAIRLFPNPTQDQLTILAEEKYIEAIQMMTTTGQEVLSQSGLSERQMELPVGHLPKGLYLLRVYIGDQWTVRKVIVE